MATTLPFAQTFSVSQAVERGIPAVVSSANSGIDIIIERHGKPQAVVIGMDRILQIQELERDLQSAALVMSRLATDTGSRTDLEAAIKSLGFDPTKLRDELAADLKAGRA